MGTTKASFAMTANVRDSWRVTLASGARYCPLALGEMWMTTDASPSTTTIPDERFPKG
jgi:hypothetical protein